MTPHTGSASHAESTPFVHATQPTITPALSTPHNQTSENSTNNDLSRDRPHDLSPDSHPPAAPSVAKPTANGQTLKHSLKTHPKVLGPLDPQSQSQTSRLLELPAELRHMIWCHALTASDRKLHYNATSRCFAQGDIAVGLLLTCHQLALETTHLHLKMNTLCFDDSLAFMRWQRRHMRTEAAHRYRVELRGVKLVRKEIRERRENGHSGGTQ